MSTFWRNAQNIEECPIMNVNEVASLLFSYLETVPIDELLQHDAFPNVSSIIPTYPHHGFDTSADLEGMQVDTRNTLLVDNVCASTSSLTRNYDRIPFKQTSAHSNPFDSRMVTSGDQMKPPVTYLGGNDDLPELYFDDFDAFLESNDDRAVMKPTSCSISAHSFMTDSNSKYNFELSFGEESVSSSRLLNDRSPCSFTIDQSSNPPFNHNTIFQPYPQTPERFQGTVEMGTYDTFLPEQSPVNATQEITDGSFHTTHAGHTIRSVPAVPFSPSSIQSHFTPPESYYRELPLHGSYMPDTQSHRLHLDAGIRPSTSRTINRIEMPHRNSVREPKFNATGQDRSLISEPNSKILYNTTNSFEGRSYRCIGPTFEGYVSLRLLYDKDSGARIYECTKCGSQFSTAYLLKLHRSKHVNNVPFECNVCPCIHTGEKQFECDICNIKKFWHREDVEGHRRVHLNVKPFHCHRCGAGFFYKSLLDSHLEAGISFL